MLVLNVPQQRNRSTPTNGVDCGVYLLQYADAFYHNISVVSHGMKKTKLGKHLHKNMFTQDDIDAKRKSMLDSFDAIVPLDLVGYDSCSKRQKR